MVISSCLMHMLHLAPYYYFGRAVLIVLIMEEKEEMVKRNFNTLRSWDLWLELVVQKVAILLNI